MATPKKPRKPRTSYVNAAGKVIKIDPQRSALMKKVMAHRKGKPLSAATKQKIATAVKKARATGKTKFGKPVRKRKSQI